MNGSRQRVSWSGSDEFINGCSMRLWVRAGLFTSYFVSCLLVAFSVAVLGTALVFAGNVSDVDSLSVNLESGGGIRATAQVFFPAKPEVIQTILTDYGRWPELFDVR